MNTTLTVILLSLGAVGLAGGITGLASVRALRTASADPKKIKKRKRLSLALAVFAGWLLAGTVISNLYSFKIGLSVEFSLLSERTSVFGVSVASTTLMTTAITGIVLILSLIFRAFVFPRFKYKNIGAFQNVFELAVESMESFARSSLHDYSGELAPYMFSLAVFMIFSAASELFGLRPPTADIVVTLSMGLITFALINFYGFRKKGFGRIKGMAKPTPVIFPMKILSDIAVPISLACRLFGNMVGGMIVMHLLKSVMGGYASGVPAVFGLYFNLFHPLIQAYIFIILSMTFINEAIEE